MCRYTSRDIDAFLYDRYLVTCPESNGKCKELLKSLSIQKETRIKQSNLSLYRFSVVYVARNAIGRVHRTCIYQNERI